MLGANGYIKKPIVAHKIRKESKGRWEKSVRYDKKYIH